MTPSVWKAAVVLGAAIAVPYCFYSVVAIWAGRSRRHWFLRAMVVAAALLLLLPIRAHEVYVFFLILVGVILAMLAVVRRFENAVTDDRTEYVEPPVRRPLRFGLTDLFLLILLVAILTTATTYVFRQPILFGWLDMLLTSTSSAVAALATAWLVFGRKRLFWRVLFWFSTTVGASLSWLAGDWLGVEDNLLLQWDKCLLFVLCYLSLFLWYMLWFGSFSAVDWPASPRAKPANKWSRLAARIFLLLTVVAVIVPTGWMYLQLARPLPAQVPVTANPNGFHDLMRAASQLDNATMPNVKTASTDALQAFVGQYANVLDQTRSALLKPCQVPLDYSPNSFRTDHLTKLRNLVRLFQVQMVLADRQSRPEDAAPTGVDCVHLADKGSRGGMLIDFLAACAIEGIGTAQIAKCRKDLNAEVCRELIAELKRIDRDREPVAEFVRRDRDWCRIAGGWRNDFWNSVFRLARGANDDSELYESICRRREATMQLLITELALQAYRLEHGQYPERLDSLVPDLINSVPIDPFDGQPLRYRLEEEDEYVLYSVGLDGDDDGGVRVSEQKMIRAEGDYFLDAIVDWLEE